MNSAGWNWAGLAAIWGVLDLADSVLTSRLTGLAPQCSRSIRLEVFTLWVPFVVLISSTVLGPQLGLRYSGPQSRTWTRPAHVSQCAKRLDHLRCGAGDDSNFEGPPNKLSEYTR